MNKLNIKNFVMTLSALLLSQQVAAACNPSNMVITRPDARYEAVNGSNGSEVRDKITNLIWMRCEIGMNWNGTTCTGTSTAHSWQSGLNAVRSIARSAVSGAGAWRIPNVSELFSLYERSCFNPYINTTWFPAVSGYATLSSSPYSSNYAGLIWLGSPTDYINYVDPPYFNSGLGYSLRLVRSAN
jgi:hypothetical protein